MSKKVEAANVAAQFKKRALSPAQWEMADDIAQQGASHPAMKQLIKQLHDAANAVGPACAEAAKRIEGYKRTGAGRTVAPDMLQAELESVFSDVESTVKTFKRQLNRRAGTSFRV